MEYCQLNFGQTMTIQENFTMLKGHVSDGQKIRMRTGEVFEIKSTISGWKIVDAEKDVFINMNSAHEVENAIVNY